MRNSEFEEIEIVLGQQDQNIRSKILKFLFQNKINFDQNHNQFIAKIRIRDVPQNKLLNHQVSQQCLQQNTQTPQFFLSHNSLNNITEYKSVPTTNPIKFNNLFMNQSNAFNKQENARKHFLINKQQKSKNLPKMNYEKQTDQKNVPFVNQKQLKKYFAINNSKNSKNNFYGLDPGLAHSNYITKSARPIKNIVPKNKDKQKKKFTNPTKNKNKQIRANQNKTYKEIQTNKNPKPFNKSTQSNLFDNQIQTFKKKDQQIQKLIKLQIQQLKQLKSKYLFLSNSISQFMNNKDQQQKKISPQQQGNNNSNKSSEINIKDLETQLENLDLCFQQNQNNSGLKILSQIKQEMSIQSQQSMICQEGKIKPCNENKDPKDNNKKPINKKAGKKRRKIFSKQLLSKTLNLKNEKQDKDNNYKQKIKLETLKKISSQIKIEQDLKQTMKKTINNKSKQIKTDKGKKLFLYSNLERLDNKKKNNNNSLINLKYYDMKDLDFLMDTNRKKSFFNNEKSIDSINQEFEPNLPNNFFSIQNNSSVHTNQEKTLSLETSLKRGMFSSAQESIEVNDNDFKIDLQKIYNIKDSFLLMTTSQKLSYLENKQREANNIYKKYFC